jgi:hypothetical protein
MAPDKTSQDHVNNIQDVDAQSAASNLAQVWFILVAMSMRRLVLSTYTFQRRVGSY